MLVPGAEGQIVFEAEYRNPDAIKGLEENSHIWLVWGFSEAFREREALTVHPPRLGGKVKKGVFATRAPYRPNSLGLSCVKLVGITIDEKLGPVITVSGVDMLDGTPIYDIKPYMPYTDSFPEATANFGQNHSRDQITVDFPEELLNILPAEHRNAARMLLEQDPRAAYNKEPGYIYGLNYAGYDIRFTADDECIKVCDVTKADEDLKKVK